MLGRIFTVGGYTLLSRLTGFARDIMLAAILGAGPVADAFFVALRLPNHFRAIFAEGAFNAAFVPAYKKATGKDVRVEQSHAGSSAQARAVADGLEADVVTMNTTTDIEFLADKGIVAKDWTKRFPNNAAPTTSTMLFLVREGNP